MGANEPAWSPDLLGPVAVKSVADQVLERMITCFALGLYPPGHRLPPERALAARLGVSRTSVREALQRLEREGYVETLRGRYGGTVVAARPPSDGGDAAVRRTLEPRWHRLEELFDVARQLLPVIGRLAAERRTLRDVAAIRRAADRYAAAHDREAAREADAAFHAAVTAAAHNGVLSQLSDQVRHEITLGLDAFPYSEDIRAQAVGDHAAIVEAVAGGDGERAGELLVAHFVELGEAPFRQVRRRTADAEAGR